jgi:hypothetical protein
MEAGAEKLSLGRVLVPARAERLKIALWAILAKEPVCVVERSMLCPDEAKRDEGARFWRRGTDFRAYMCFAVQV